MPRRLSSSCRQFRRQHAEFVDGYLSDEALCASRAHLDECPACAHHDVLIRRSLLAVQALPMIEPSAGFHDRLCERLSREAHHYAPVQSRGVRWGMATVIVAASAALFLAASYLPRQPAMSPPAPVSVPVLAGAPERPTVATEVKDPTRAATVSRPFGRFEALPGQAPARRESPMVQGPLVRLQTASYIGQ
jgi:anti-sigma factor RsiW